MSVFTPVAAPDLRAWLAECGAGALDAFQGVEGGVENTNYHVATDSGRFVLTLFEWQPKAAAERTLALTHALAEAGLPVARPWPQHGGWTAPLAGKPAALSAWLDGVHPERPTPAQCSAIGRFLGELHVSFAADCATPTIAPANPRGIRWMRGTAAKLDPHLSPADRERIDEVLADVSSLPDLPRGVIHADLFRDNALFEGDALRGVIDFHYACEGPLLYDVAVAALDWCGDHASLRAMCTAYASRRPLAHDEGRWFGRLIQRAALRFWLSRAYDAIYPRPGRAVTAKDPGAMRARLAALRTEPPDWLE